MGEIRTKSLEALARSRDLRVLVHLAATAIRTDGLAAFLDILGVTAQWLERTGTTSIRASMRTRFCVATP